jgi:hypothetical protein
MSNGVYLPSEQWSFLGVWLQVSETDTPFDGKRA